MILKYAPKKSISIFRYLDTLVFHFSEDPGSNPGWISMFCFFFLFFFLTSIILDCMSESILVACEVGPTDPPKTPGMFRF